MGLQGSGDMVLHDFKRQHAQCVGKVGRCQGGIPCERTEGKDSANETERKLSTDHKIDPILIARAFRRLAIRMYMDQHQGMESCDAIGNVDELARVEAIELQKEDEYEKGQSIGKPNWFADFCRDMPGVTVHEFPG